MQLAAPALEEARPYVPRPVRFIRRERLGDWQLKVYGIAAAGETPREELVERAVEIASDVLPHPAVGDSRYGVGFVIAHDAASLAIVIAYWWQSQNELHQRIYTGPLDDLAALTQLSDQPAGCVWELGVVDFERRAWLEDVLASPDGPDLNRYLSRELETTF
jgi:hypothetical protein